MTLVLTLFFVSLASIAVMLGRKLVLVKEVPTEIIEEKILLGIPNVEEIKRATLKGLKNYSFVILVVVIRVYVKSSNFIKRRSKDVAEVVKSKLKKKGAIGEVPEKQEVSKFLKLVSEYKQKVKRIKRKIKEEENVE